MCESLCAARVAQLGVATQNTSHQVMCMLVSRPKRLRLSTTSSSVRSDVVPPAPHVKSTYNGSVQSATTTAAASCEDGPRVVGQRGLQTLTQLGHPPQALVQVRNTILSAWWVILKGDERLGLAILTLVARSAGTDEVDDLRHGGGCGCAGRARDSATAVPRRAEASGSTQAVGGWEAYGVGWQLVTRCAVSASVYGCAVCNHRRVLRRRRRVLPQAKCLVFPVFTTPQRYVLVVSIRERRLKSTGSSWLRPSPLADAC